MATAAQLRLPEGKQATVDFDPIWVGSSIYDLTSVLLTAYVKASEAVPDSDPSVAVITATPGPNGAITVTDAAGGLATLTIDGSVIPVPATLFWHLDATDGTGATGTVAYGPVYVEATSTAVADVPPEPAGTQSGDQTYTQIFGTASVVSVVHNLGKYPAVSVTDTALDEVEGDVRHLSTAALTVSFSAPFSGTVICN
jgi:hypothetical protein